MSVLCGHARRQEPPQLQLAKPLRLLASLTPVKPSRGLPPRHGGPIAYLPLPPTPLVAEAGAGAIRYHLLPQPDRRP